MTIILFITNHANESYNILKVNTYAYGNNNGNSYTKSDRKKNMLSTLS